MRGQAPLLHAPWAPPLWRLRLFSLNDYLGLSAHPDVAAAAAKAATSVGGRA